MIDLLNLIPDQPAKIISVEGGKGLILRLKNLGIREGVIIKKVKGYSWGGPIVVRIGNTQLALGRGMASKIMVEPE